MIAAFLCMGVWVAPLLSLGYIQTIAAAVAVFGVVFVVVIVLSRFA
jgi:hypothetical protein